MYTICVFFKTYISKQYQDTVTQQYPASVTHTGFSTTQRYMTAISWSYNLKTVPSQVTTQCIYNMHHPADHTSFLQNTVETHWHQSADGHFRWSWSSNSGSNSVNIASSAGGRLACYLCGGPRCARGLPASLTGPLTSKDLFCRPGCLSNT